MTEYLKYYYEQKEAVDRRIAEDTERNRKANAVLHFTDKDGKPLTVRNLRIRQKNHSFKFGCNIFMLDQFPDEEHNRAYREKFPELFNYAIVPFYWSDYEVEEGKPRDGLNPPYVYRRPGPEQVLQYTEENGIGVKGHCLMWQHFLPTWLQEDGEKTMACLQRRISHIAERYGKRIPDFDIVNETLARNPYAPYEKKMPYDCTNRTFLHADGVLTGNRLFINETTEYTWQYFNRENSAYYLQIESLLAKGRRIDAIGLQYHLFRRPEVLAKDCETLLHPTRLFDLMDYYAHFGRPLHVSEITVPAYANREGSLEEQAEITELLYRLWFSHEAMEGIIWWNLVDGTAAYAPLGSTEGENYYRGGLLNYDMTEKPVYRVLNRLINEEWKTSLDAATAEGSYAFRGFLGDYEITAETEDGRTVKAEFSLEKNKDNRCQILFD